MALRIPRGPLAQNEANETGRISFAVGDPPSIANQSMFPTESMRIIASRVALIWWRRPAPGANTPPRPALSSAMFLPSCTVSALKEEEKMEVGAYAMKRVATGARLRILGVLILRNAQTTEPTTAWTPDDGADYCLGTRR